MQSYADVIPHGDKIPDTLPPARPDIDAVVIQTDPSAPIPSVKGARRLTPKELEVCRTTIDEYLRKGWLVPSRSPYSSPILFVQKKNGSLRLCCDFRQINKISVKQSWPLPNISELIDKLQGAKYFSTLDLVSGYMQLRLHPDDQPKTAIRTPFGLYEWKTLCFGLSNAPSHFQSAMSRMLEPLIAAGKCLVYLDDIICVGRTPREHMDNLREVLAVLRANKLYASHSKCSFRPPLNFSAW
jgi:hypothetical protein